MKKNTKISYINEIQLKQKQILKGRLYVGLRDNQKNKLAPTDFLQMPQRADTQKNICYGTILETVVRN